MIEVALGRREFTMARPRIFISSTYYDLKYIRGGLEAFVRQMGYDPILFEKGDIPFRHVEDGDVCLRRR